MAYFTSGNATRKRPGGVRARTPKPLTLAGDKTGGGGAAPPPTQGYIWPRKAK